MLLPEKHITLAQSIIGLSGMVLKFINEPKFVDDIWKEYCAVNNSRLFPAEHNYNNFLLAIYFLFTIGIVNINNDQKIYICG